MKLYAFRGSIYQFDDGGAPAGAVEIAPEQKPAPRDKQGKPSGKK